MMIPFTGTCSLKQYVPGKPNPEGLKAFVMANPNGLILDFEIYQGPTTCNPDIRAEYGLGAAAVLHLSHSPVPGHILYFDRFSTSPRLMKSC